MSYVTYRFVVEITAMNEIPREVAKKRLEEVIDQIPSAESGFEEAEIVSEEREEWKALDSHVIVVAVKGAMNDWAAYIGSVAGKNHDLEWREVLSNGTKLSKKVAEVLFPHFAEKYVWRP